MDNVTVYLQTDKPIHDVNMTIQNHTVVPYINNNTLIANLTISENDTNGNMTFNIILTDVQTATQITELNLTSSNVFIDTMPPIITSYASTCLNTPSLNPDSDASVSDNDPAYNGTIFASVYTDSTTYRTIDRGSSSSLFGGTYSVLYSKTYHIDYTATPDIAGNVPETVTKYFYYQYGARCVMTTELLTSEYIPPDNFQIVNSGSSNLLFLTSNNSDPTYAKTGDTLNLNFTVNQMIANGTAWILNSNLTNMITIIDENFSTSIIIPSTEREEYANFMAMVMNHYNETLTISPNNLSFGVFVDTKNPEISLVGNSTYTVLTNSNSVIPGAIATDGDPNYTGGYNTITNGTLNTSIPNSTILYTYTANSDGAGNIGNSVTRTVTVVSEPITPTLLKITSSSSNNFARSDQNITVTLEMEGFDLTNATGTLLGREFTTNIVANSTIFAVTVLPDDINGNTMFSITVTNSNGYIITVTNEDITDGSSVTVDTVSPTIELNGQSEIMINTNATFTDLNAIAYDLSYGNQTISTTDTVNTTVPGMYTLRYKALDDIAGNIGPVITRIVTVISASTCTDDLSSYNIILGTNYADVLDGTLDNDLIYGLDGDDVINGLGGNDCIYGDEGHDIIDGGGGNDTIVGGIGHDVLDGKYGHDIIHGGFGNDTITGGFGLDTLYGDVGHDIIYGGGENDIINGGFGFDMIYGDGGDDIIDGGGGNDTIVGGNGHDVLDGKDGHDIIHGGFGNDTITGGFGLDTLYGDVGHDIIYGGGENDIINGGFGFDMIYGDGGDDIIDGGGGNDTIVGGNGHDVLDGKDGHDIIHGGFGNDTITGGFGLDTLYGDGGYDIINGGGANDTITGGTGDDNIDGGLHSDIINGDAGNDTCVATPEDIVDCEIKT